MSPDEREQAAQGYEQVAQQMVGTQAELARLYNLERAKFLRDRSAGSPSVRLISPPKLVIPAAQPTQAEQETEADV